MPTSSLMNSLCLSIGLLCTVTFTAADNAHAQDALPLEGSALDAITVVEPKAADSDSQEKDAVIPTRESGTAVEPQKSVVGPMETETVMPSKEEGTVVERTLDIVSILPTVEFRPTRDALKEQGIEAVVPYASLGLGVNSNSFSEASRLGNSSASFHDTFALRVAGGIDVPITSHLALNGEMAWNRNSGGYQLNATDGSFNASTLNLLVGIRAQF